MNIASVPAFIMSLGLALPALAQTPPNAPQSLRNNVDFIHPGVSDRFPIAVIDSGVDYTHPDLAPHLHLNTQPTPVVVQGIEVREDVHGYDFNEKDNRPFDNNYVGYRPAFVPISMNSPSDFLNSLGQNAFELLKTVLGMGSPGHGTHVSGILLKECEGTCAIVPVKVFGGNGNSLKDLAAALEYIRIRNYRLVNMSLGVHTSYIKKADKEEVAAFEQAKAIIEQTPDTLYVVAAGNDGKHLTDENEQIYPAMLDLPNVLVVGAVNDQGELARFSNFDPVYVDVFASGVDVRSTWNDGQYKEASGTSMAAPFVTGVIAKLWSNESQLSAVEIKEKFLNLVPTRTVNFREREYSVRVILEP